MTLNQLQYFLVTARELHFGRAARELHIAQPSLSRSLANLEEELGLALFERRGHSVSLTEAGTLLQEQAQRILGQVDIARRQMLCLKAGSDEEVRLSYTSTGLAAGLAGALSRFTQSYAGPGRLRLFTDEAITVDAVQGIKDGRYDLSICMRVDKDPEIEQIPLFSAPYTLIVPNSCPLTEECTLKQAAQYPIIIYRAGVARKFVENIFENAGVQPDFRHLTYSDEASIELVGEGLGISVVNELFCHDSDPVRRLHPSWLNRTQVLYLTHRAGRQKGRAVQQLEQFLLKDVYRGGKAR